MNLTELIENLTWSNLVNKIKEILNLIPKSGEDIVTKIDEELGSDSWQSGGSDSEYTFGGGLTETDGVVTWYQEAMPGALNQFTPPTDGIFNIGNLMAPGPYGLSIAIDPGDNNSVLGLTGNKLTVEGHETLTLAGDENIVITTSNSVDIQTTNLNISGIPTSSVGLSSGDLWVDTDTIKIVP